MKKTILISDFRDAFVDMGRYNQFSYEALGALFDYYEELEDSIGEEIELDVIAICCEWAEYDGDQFSAEFGDPDIAPSDYDDPDDYDDAKMRSAIYNVEYESTLIRVDGGTYLVLNF